MEQSNSFGGEGTVDIKGVKGNFAEMVQGFKGYSDGKQELLKDFAAFISKRGEIEQSYSRDLQKLVDKYAAKRGRTAGGGGRTTGGGGLRGLSDKDNSSLDSESLGDGSSMNAAMEEVLNSTRKRSEAHNELSQVLSTDVKAMLDQMQVEALTNARKCHVWISSIQAEYLKTLKDLDDKMKAYHKEKSGFNKVEETMEKTHEKGKGYTKKGTKLKGKLAVQERKATEARNDYLISLVSSNAMREQLYQHEVEGVFDAMDFEYVQAFKNVNHEIFKAMKGAANHDSEASDDLWKAVCEIPENEAKLQFMHKNSRCLATREIALAPVSDDNVTKLVFVNEEDGLGKFRLVEQQVSKAERDILLMQKSIEEYCAEMAAVGGPVLPPPPDDGIPQDSPAAAVTDAFGKRSHAFLNRAANLAMLESIGTSLGAKRPNLLEDNGVAIITLDPQIPWVVPSTQRFVLRGDTPPMGVSEGVSSGLAPPTHDAGQPRPSPRSRAGASMHAKSAVRCFEDSLTGIASKTGEPIPTVVESSITWLDTEEHIRLKGLFRISGGLAEVERLKAAFNSGKDPLAKHAGEHDPHAVAGCLKLFLRELPESVFTFTYYSAWLQMGSIPDPDTRILAMRELLHNRMPPEHKAVLQRLLPFLKKLSQHEASNKMSVVNLATVFGPTLMPAPQGDLTAVLRDTSAVTGLMTFILEHVDAVCADDSTVVAAHGAPTDPADPTDAASTTVEMFKARALYDYTARAAEELSFQAGDVLSVFAQLDGNWWRGALKGEHGFIAAAYVAPLDDDRAALVAADYSPEHDDDDAADDADDADDYLHVTAVDGTALDDDEPTAGGGLPVATERAPAGVSPARPVPPTKAGGTVLAKDPMQAALAAAAMAVVAGTGNDAGGDDGATRSPPSSFKRPGRKPPGPPSGDDRGTADAPRKLIPARRPPGIPGAKPVAASTGGTAPNAETPHRLSTTSEDSFCAISPPAGPPLPAPPTDAAPTEVAPPPPLPEEPMAAPVVVQMDTQMYQNSVPTPAPTAVRRKSMADLAGANASAGAPPATMAPGPTEPVGPPSTSDSEAAPPMFMPPPPPPPADDTDTEGADTPPPVPEAAQPPPPTRSSSPPPDDTSAAAPAPTTAASTAESHTPPPPKVTPKPRPQAAATATAAVPTPTKKKAPPPVRARSGSDGVALRRPPPTIRTKKPAVANRLSIAPDFAPPAPPPGPPTEESAPAPQPPSTVGNPPSAVGNAPPAAPPVTAPPHGAAETTATADPPPPPTTDVLPEAGGGLDDAPPAPPPLMSDDDVDFASVENLPPPPPPLEPEGKDDVAPLPSALPPLETFDHHRDTPDTEDDEIDC